MYMLGTIEGPTEWKLHWVFSWLLTNELLCEKGQWFTNAWPGSKFSSLRRLVDRPESGSLLNCGLNWLGIVVSIEMGFNRRSTSLIRACITKRHLIQCNYWLSVIDGWPQHQCILAKEAVRKRLFCRKAAFLCLGWRWGKYLIWTSAFTEFLH